ncbi:antigen WC1.1-like [Vidua macroura]|uniref:antigen WC1.1-like n=1 Tax=Vidua macroura TaxID=187451 RepID=UPI0023A8A7A9|nr:antigen WC1.1-like [Vidua macroura]
MRGLIKAALVLLPALARALVCESCPGCAGSGPVAMGPVAMGPVAALGLLRGPRRWRARLSSLRAAGSGELRLVGGGGGRCAGRVEVKHGGEWGSVCVFDYDVEALWAVVVCRQLGCGRVASSSPYAPFGQGSGRIWLQPFFCRGAEDTLEECRHFGWGRHFCGHERDVGVTCTDAVELRLAGGSSACAGRVEVKLQGQWGSVGDNDWDMEDAEVVCQQLGCGSASGAYYARDTFGLEGWLVSLVQVDCSGNEATLWDCKIRSWGLYNSSVHYWDAAVVCQGFSRLVGGDGACAGRLEVRQGRAWVGVCEDQVDMKAAQVVCRELGCGEALAIPGRAGFGRGSGSFLDRGFQCNGSEPLLSACARRPAHRQGCTGPASVTCSSYTGFRLGNSSSGCSGRVEVAVRGTWGSVCASEWDLADAHVLCRQLGCGRAFSVPPGGSFGSGEGPLRPDAFGCSGSERHPGECPVAVLGKPPCAPGNAAAVNCSGSVESLRLVEGETRCDGFLEMAVSTGAWHRVPGEVSPVRNFSKVCWELGCGGLDRTDAVHGQIYLSDVNTTERPMTESVIPTIMDTTPNATTGTISDDNFGNEREFVTTAPADIPHGSYTVCSGSRQVRLVGSSGRCAGRVEVYSGGSWSSVCQEGWDLQDAAVVCRQLGCGRALEAPSSARSGAVPGPLWPYIPDCSGSEESLWECGRTERRQCGRGGGAGAVCSGQCRAPPDQGPAEAPGGSWPCRDPPAPLAEQLLVQLAGGHGRCRGYLEVSYNGTWGRVCASGTSSGTAAAVCRQLGCGDQGSLSPVPSQQPPLAWLAWVGCEDGARSLWGCPSAPWHLQSCGTDGYAQVECEEDSDGTSDGHSAPYPEGATSTGVPSRTPSAVALGTVPVPTVLCVVLGTLLCLSLGALALLLCRARARRRGPGKAADATSNAIYEELDYKAMPESQEVPTPPGSLSEGWVKKLPYYTGDSVEGSDTEAAPDPPAQPEQGSPDGYDDALDMPQEAPAPSTGDISEGVARQKWICVLPTGGISSPPSSPGATKDPTDQPPGHMDYDDVGCSALGTLPHPAVAGQPGHGPCLRHVVLQEVPDLRGDLQSPEGVQILQQGLAEARAGGMAELLAELQEAVGSQLGVTQAQAGSGELRLVGGGGRCAGRVEVKHGGEWGSVCVFDYDGAALWAVVVCRQLGCGRVARVSPYASFGQGSGRIWLQPFYCLGTEDTLEQCLHLGWGRHFCGHERDVGVTCTDAVELRLSGGSSPCAGRVEVKLQGQWGSVADDNWDMEDAEVVCQHVGCGSASGAYYALDTFGLGVGLISLSLVDCSGKEATLLDCKIRGWGPYNSSIHEFDTAVVCQGFSRLVGGDGACAGRLEVRQGRAWVGVCEDQVDMKAAQVVCRELGCGEALAIPGRAGFGRGSGSFLDRGFQCNGSEPLLSACARRPAHRQGCTGPASVTCSSYTGFRLGNSSSGCSGRVEVAVRGTWGSVCASEWDLADAHVLCRQLGCGRAFSVPPGGSFGSGEGPLRPDAFGCSGSERHPGECPVAVLGKPPCAPGNAAAVNCSGSAESLRLVEGESRCDGFLEMAVSTGAWHRVPGEVSPVRNFSKVCWELGCGGLDRTDAVHGQIYLSDVNTTERPMTERVIPAIMDTTPNATTGTISDDNFGNEREFVTTAAADIPHGNYTVCSGSRQVRLVGSSGRCAGRVEVYSGGSWSSVCQEGWDLQDAAVVCRQLGCGRALDAPSSARSGAVPGPLWPYIPDCSGSEESLWECRRTERRQCGRGGGAGAVCSEQLSVRLAGGHGRCRGYLEVSYNGTWGRVCASGTSSGTAAAVCRQLGCGDRGSLSPVPSQQPSLAWLAWVGCEDGARSLWGCPSAPWHLQSCGTDGYAQVECEEDSDGTSDGHSAPYPEGATSTGVPSRTPSAVALGTVPVPTVLCVVLGTLLCLSLGALALLLCRARARRRGPGKAADATFDAIYEELDYKAMPESQEVPTPPGSLSEGWVKKLPYYTRDSVEGSDSEAAPDPPAQPEQGSPDGYDDALDVPQEPHAPSTGDISEGVARQKWICVLPTGTFPCCPQGGISSPPSSLGATKDPTDQPPGHMDYDDVGCSALGTLP